MKVINIQTLLTLRFFRASLDVHMFITFAIFLIAFYGEFSFSFALAMNAKG